MLSHFARFARISPHSLASLLARASLPTCLLCSLAHRLASAGLRSRSARACRLTCLLRSPCELLASLDPPLPLLAPLVASPAALPRFNRAASPACSLRSPPHLLCPRFDRQLACCSLRARHLNCRSLRSPLAAPPAARSSFAVYLPDLLARLTRLARFASSAFSPRVCTGWAVFAELTLRRRDGGVTE